MKIKILALALVLSIFCATNHAQWNISDSTMSFGSYNLQEGSTLVLNGKNTVTIGKLSGNGLILVESGITLMRIKDLSLFSGTFECNGECVLYTLTSPDEIKMKTTGSGKLNLRKLEEHSASTAG